MYNVFIKDLKKLGRRMEDILILDNSPISYLFQKQNALPIKTWLDDRNDIELYKYLRPLEYLAKVDDVRDVISRIVDQDKNQIDFEVFDEIATKSNYLNMNNDRKKYNSESRKLVFNKVGYSSMLEAGQLYNLRELSNSRGNDKRNDLLSKNSRHSPMRNSHIKPDKTVNGSMHKVKHETLNINDDDVIPLSIEDDIEKHPIFSAQYSALAPKRTKQTKDSKTSLKNKNSKVDSSNYKTSNLSSAKKLYRYIKPQGGASKGNPGLRGQRKKTKVMYSSTPENLQPKVKRNYSITQKSTWSAKSSIADEISTSAKVSSSNKL
jgi:hypothetical protein